MGQWPRTCVESWRTNMADRRFSLTTWEEVGASDPISRVVMVSSNHHHSVLLMGFFKDPECSWHQFFMSVFEMKTRPTTLAPETCETTKFENLSNLVVLFDFLDLTLKWGPIKYFACGKINLQSCSTFSHFKQKNTEIPLSPCLDIQSAVTWGH